MQMAEYAVHADYAYIRKYADAHRSDASQNDQGLSTCLLMRLMRVGKYGLMANPNHG